VFNVKKFALRFVLLLILCSVLVSLPQINIVRASETIYIRADGSVEGTDKVQRNGNVYTFIDNIYDSIVVERNDIVVDGAGYILQGTGVYESLGIDLSHRSDVTISNTRIRYFDDGIRLGKSSNKIVDNYLTNNSDGICLESSSKNNIISGNNITNNWSGIRIRGSNNIISANNITNNKNYGIYFDYSSNNSIVGNNIKNNTCGIYFYESSNNIVSHNNFINNTKHVKDAHSDAPWLIPPSVNIWDDSVEGNHWSDYEDRYPDATELDSSGIWDTPYIIYGNNQDNHPLMTYWIPSPTISIASPENKRYTVNHVSLTFTLSEPSSWIGYSLDGQTIVKIAGNTTLTGLSAGSHSLIVYTKDAAGNTEASEIICFSIKTQQSELSPTWIVATAVIIAVVGAALLVYFRKIRKTTEVEKKEQTPEGMM
jgi:parallel beta-helix repeat protein